MNNKLLYYVLIVSFIGILVWSLINPKDIFIWGLEVFPAIIGLIIIIFTFKKFRLSNLLYVLIWIHAVILVIGGHYTYAEVPFFNWLKDSFDLSRNYYDRVGHFFQGFVPAMIAREILLRKSKLEKGKMLNFIIISICLAISASYELIEWFVAEVTGTAAEAFLGTQGDIWDTQWDMFLALCGAVISLIVLRKLHDRKLIEENLLDTNEKDVM
jgi:putative membrane protein